MTKKADTHKTADTTPHDDEATRHAKAAEAQTHKGGGRRLDEERESPDDTGSTEARKKELYKELADLGEVVPAPYTPHTPQEFPKMLYSADGQQVTVQSQADADALEGTWTDAPPVKDEE